MKHLNIPLILFLLFLAMEVSAQLQPIHKGIQIFKGAEKYKGKIQVHSDTVTYDNVTVRLFIPPPYKIIFENGIFYPGILFGDTTGSGQWEKTSLDSLNISSIKMGNLSISAFEEIDHHSYQTKRFKFWVFRVGLANPTEYIMDLHNDAATGSTDLKTFLSNAKISYIKYVTIII